MPRSRTSIAALALAAAAFGCTSNDASRGAKLAVPDGGVTPLGDGGDAGGDAAAPDAGQGGAAAGPAPLLLGITANAAQEAPLPGEVAEAVLTTLAAGARAVVLSRAWRDLGDDPAGALSSAAALYAAHGEAVVVNLAVVDRAADERPPPLAGTPWNGSSTEHAVEAAIDAAVGAFGPSLRAITFGRDTDRYLASHEGERAAFVSFAMHAMAYARGHGGGALAVGVAFSDAGATTPDPSFDLLLGAGDVAALSLVAGLSGEPPADPAAALDALAAAARGKPIVLQAVGAPSAGLDQASPEQQALFYKTFFDALAPRRAAFGVVDVYELSDEPPARCAAIADAQGEPADGAFAARACALGLFTLDGAPKPAWAEVLHGAAAFATP